MSDLVPQPVLVTGASGFVGGHLLRYLRARGIRARAMARREAAVATLRADGWEVVRADLTVPDSLAAAVAGAAAVVHLGGAADVSDPALNRAVNVDGSAALGRAASAAGVRRVVLFSSHCAVRPLRDAYGQTKLESEQALAASGVPLIVFRPTMIYGEGSAEFTTFVRAVRWLPRVPIIGDGKATIRPVLLDDVLPAVVEALRRPVAGRTYEICGPGPVSFDRLVALIAEHLGRRRVPLHVPGRLALAGARLLGRLLRHPPITVDQVMGFLQHTVADAAPATRDLGFDPCPIEVGLARLFGRTAVRQW